MALKSKKKFRKNSKGSRKDSRSPRNSSFSKQSKREKSSLKLKEEQIPPVTMDLWQDFSKEVNTTQGKNKVSINLKNTQERAKTSEMKVRVRKKPHLLGALNNDIKVDDLSNQLESRQVDLSQ